jgi:Protein of unknown function (DUF3048) N-terminal domain/Protein of unknown function (DUF3048) C-terminal domain
LSLTRRGKLAAAIGTVTVLAVAVVGFFVAFPDKAPAFVRTTMSRVGLADAAPPPTCPLTGAPAPHAVVPDRPALAIKVENAPEARPQTGLNDADIVFEEPVEGGYTRFIAVFQCAESPRVGPVRSGRMTDPDVLVQLGRPALGYAGGVKAVKDSIAKAGLIDVNYIVASQAYTRDDARVAPHNLYTSTRALYKAARSREGVPASIFAYAPELSTKAKRVGTAHLPFSSVSDVSWAWSRRRSAWLRSHGTTPHETTDGGQVSAANVVILEVEVRPGHILDAAGNPSPVVTLTGSGKAYILRDGRMVTGTWDRRTLSDVTSLVAKDGSEIALAPGRTWVELMPSDIAVTTER